MEIPVPQALPSVASAEMTFEQAQNPKTFSYRVYIFIPFNHPSTNYVTADLTDKSSKQNKNTAIERGGNYSKLFYENQLETLEIKLNEKIKNSFNINQLQQLRNYLSENYGDEIELVFDRIWTFVGVYVYDRTTRFSKYNELVFIR